MARKKVKGITQVDGKVDGPQPSIDEILGEAPSHGYQSKSLEEYEASLKDMNLSDLHTEAVNRGVIPNTDDRNRLIDRLVRVFRQETNRYNFTAREEPAFSKEQRKRAEDLLK